MQQRYFDPLSGRFLSVDPVTAYSNPVGAFNRYWYANNNPYRFTDPDGRMAFDDSKERRRPEPQRPRPEAPPAPPKPPQPNENKPAPNESDENEIKNYFHRAWEAFGKVLKASNEPIETAMESPAVKATSATAGAAAVVKVPVVTPVVEGGGAMLALYEFSAVLSSAAAAILIPIQDMQGPDAPLNFATSPEERK